MHVHNYYAIGIVANRTETGATSALKLHRFYYHTNFAPT